MNAVVHTLLHAKLQRVVSRPADRAAILCNTGELRERPEQLLPRNRGTIECRPRKFSGKWVRHLSQQSVTFGQLRGGQLVAPLVRLQRTRAGPGIGSINQDAPAEFVLD